MALFFSGARFALGADTVDLKSIRHRVDSGEVQALQDLKALAKEDALRELEDYTLPTVSDDPKVSVMAIQIMVEMQVEPIYEKRLAALAAIRSPGVIILLTRLGKFKTRAAIRIIGKYLSDDRKPVEPQDDVIWGSYGYAALEALGNSGIPDAPTPPDPSGVLYGEKEMDLWRQWWEAKKHRFDP